VADDSHLGTVVSDQPREVVEASAKAFLPSLEAGAGAVMVSHVTFSALGPLPASVEPAAYELLRSLGFDGVAMTDSLGMGAIVQRWPIPQAAVVALNAGADVVLVNQGVEAVGIRDAIVAAVADGTLPEARLDEAVGRMLTLRGQDPHSMTCPG
jgi:beta-N-acetylhexosaminidase